MGNETMQTIPIEQVFEFAQDVDSGSSSEISSPCLVYKAGNCPDQRKKQKLCGVCPIAQRDHQIIVRQLKDKGLSVAHGPQKMWYTETIYYIEFEGQHGVTISHSDGSILFERS